MTGRSHLDPQSAIADLSLRQAETQLAMAVQEITTASSTAPRTSTHYGLVEAFASQTDQLIDCSRQISTLNAEIATAEKTAKRSIDDALSVDQDRQFFTEAKWALMAGKHLDQLHIKSGQWQQRQADVLAWIAGSSAEIAVAFKALGIQADTLSKLRSPLLELGLPPDASLALSASQDPLPDSTH